MLCCHKAHGHCRVDFLHVGFTASIQLLLGATVQLPAEPSEWLTRSTDHVVCPPPPAHVIQAAAAGWGQAQGIQDVVGPHATTAVIKVCAAQGVKSNASQDRGRKRTQTTATHRRTRVILRILGVQVCPGVLQMLTNTEKQQH
jgi:hypothetical protein